MNAQANFDSARGVVNGYQPLVSKTISMPSDGLSAPTDMNFSQASTGAAGAYSQQQMMAPSASMYGQSTPNPPPSYPSMPYSQQPYSQSYSQQPMYPSNTNSYSDPSLGNVPPPQPAQSPLAEALSALNPKNMTTRTVIILLIVAGGLAWLYYKWKKPQDPTKAVDATSSSSSPSRPSTTPACPPCPPCPQITIPPITIPPCVCTVEAEVEDEVPRVSSRKTKSYDELPSMIAGEKGDGAQERADPAPVGHLGGGAHHASYAAY